MHIEAYQQFLKSKVAVSKTIGFEVDDSELSPILKPHQRVAVKWAIRGGRRAIFAAFGLGKSIMQLEVLRLILKRTGGRGLIAAPLGVRQEFIRDAKMLGIELVFVRRIEECAETGIYITNFETIRDGKLDPGAFAAASVDEGAILAGMGSVKTFREFLRLFKAVPYRFVATATPDPNEFIELLAYAEFLGVMEIGEGKTRFFKRDPAHADRLTLHPHKAEEFWMWLSTWALFLQLPSDFGFSDEGYALPPLKVFYHEVKISADSAIVEERDGQMRIPGCRDAALGVTEAAREKRSGLTERVEQARQIALAAPGDRFLLWHDLEDERHAIEKAIPESVSVYGSQDLEVRESAIIDFSEGRIQHLAGKAVICGAGCNFQRHCHKAIFVGITYKFRDFIQAIHRVYRFLQTHEVEIHIIYSDGERKVLEKLLAKWEAHKKQVTKMAELIKEYGLSELALAQAMTRSLGLERVEIKGENFTLVNNDSILEAGGYEYAKDGKYREIRDKIADNSVGLVLTSIPFSTQYEYSPSFNDFGHNEDNEQFFRQMDFLTPELYRALIPGRIAAIHVKDRVVPGGINGMGVQSVYPFHVDCIQHFQKHGFLFLGMKTIVTDVVRENNQTYRLGWSEQCKDGTKMGYGIPEYLLLFRKPQTDRSKGYGDSPVRKDKKRYSKARWQVDAHGFARSDGNRPLTPREIIDLPLAKDFHQKVFGMFHDYYQRNVYNFENHVLMGEALEARGVLPVTFMLLQPPSWHPDVWTDITRMLTLNSMQSAKGRIKHLCPMQLDIADRVIVQMSNEGDLVLDPFSGLGTVPARAVALKRKGYGIELNNPYFLDSALYCNAEERKLGAPMLFDCLPEQAGEAVA